MCVRACLCVCVCTPTLLLKKILNSGKGALTFLLSHGKLVSTHDYLLHFLRNTGVHFGIITFPCVLCRDLILFIVNAMMKNFLALLEPKATEHVGRNAHGTLGHRN